MISSASIGLYAPNLAASLGGLYLFGRILYTLGYINAGPSGRLTKGGLLASVGYYRECLLSCDGCRADEEDY